MPDGVTDLAALALTCHMSLKQERLDLHLFFCPLSEGRLNEHM